MKSWFFTFDGVRGRATPYAAGANPAGVWVQWGGCGFHLAGQSDSMIFAVLSAREEVRP